jgi:hypothetical protein
MGTLNRVKQRLSAWRVLGTLVFLGSYGFIAEGMLPVMAKHRDAALTCEAFSAAMGSQAQFDADAVLDQVSTALNNRLSRRESHLRIEALAAEDAEGTANMIRVFLEETELSCPGLEAFGAARERVHREALEEWAQRVQATESCRNPDAAGRARRPQSKRRGRGAQVSSVEEIREIMSEHVEKEERALMRCWEQALERDPNHPQTRIELGLSIGIDGQVVELRTRKEEPDQIDEAFKQCVNVEVCEWKIEGLVLRRPQIIEYPFVFKIAE